MTRPCSLCLSSYCDTTSPRKFCRWHAGTSEDSGHKDVIRKVKRLETTVSKAMSRGLTILWHSAPMHVNGVFYIPYILYPMNKICAKYRKRCRIENAVEALPHQFQHGFSEKFTAELPMANLCRVNVARWKTEQNKSWTYSTDRGEIRCHFFWPSANTQITARISVTAFTRLHVTTEGTIAGDAPAPESVNRDRSVPQDY